MINFTAQTGQQGLTYIKANAFGKEFYNVLPKDEVPKWKRRAAANLVVRRLLSICAQRRIAYKKKEYPDKFDILHDVELQILHLKGHHSPKHVLRVIHKLGPKIKIICPTKENCINRDVDEILAYCKEVVS